MRDCKVAHQVKDYDNYIKDEENRRIESRLQLRKETLFNNIMKKRHKEFKESLLSINIQILNIPQHITEAYSNTDNSDKIDFLSKIIIESSKDTCMVLIQAMWNQSNFFQHQSSTMKSSDILKWGVYQLLQLTKNLNNDNDDDEADIVISKDLFLSLISEAYESNDLAVKNASLESLLNYSSVSKTLTTYFISDYKFIHLLFKLTYINSKEIIQNIILIIHNIFFDFPKEVQLVLNAISIHVRCAELLTISSNNNEPELQSIKIKCDILLLIKVMAENYPKDQLRSPFEPFIFIIHQYFINNEISNELLLDQCIDVLNQLSFNDDLCLMIISSGLGLQLLNLLSKKNMQNDYVFKLILIVINLLYYNEIIDYLLSNNLLSIIQSIINTYINSCNRTDNDILIQIAYALSNVSGGTVNHNNMLFSTKIPQSLEMMCKAKTNLRLTKEVVVFYKNAINCSDEKVFAYLMQNRIVEFLTQQLYRYGDKELIMLCLNCIRNIIIRMNELYHIYENVKNELVKYGGTKKIEELIMNKNQDVSLIAADIITMLDLVTDKVEMD